MKKTLLITALVTVAACGQLEAQNAVSGAAANAQNTNQNLNSSISYAEGGNNVAVYIPENLSTSAQQTTRYEGSYKVRSAPAVAAPGIITAHNCALGVSVGASAIGGGISFGGSYVDDNCERISQAAAINTLAGRRAALIHLAQNADICKSLRDAGAIGAQSRCGDEPEAKPVASTKSAVAVAYRKCEFTEAGAIRVTVKRGADRDLAVAQCKTSLR